MKKRVAVIIPAYNEAPVIKSVLSSAKAVFDKSKHEIDIIVINDGSTDDTSLIARDSGVIVVDHILNSGAGGATLTGLYYAKRFSYDIAATMDADGQHSPSDIEKGINHIIKSQTDMVIGSRLINTDGMSTIKIIGNKGLSFITKLLYGVNVSDSQSGLRVFSRAAIINLGWRSVGYEFCSEMIWRARQLDLKISEYSIQAIYTDYSRSKGQNNWNGVNIVRNLALQRITEMFE